MLLLFMLQQRKLKGNSGGSMYFTIYSFMHCKAIHKINTYCSRFYVARMMHPICIHITRIEIGLPCIIAELHNSLR